MLHQPSSPKSGRVRHEDRKEQLLDVATHLFAKYGLEGTTTKDIAKAAGVSPVRSRGVRPTARVRRVMARLEWLNAISSCQSMLRSQGSMSATPPPKV